MDWMPCCKPQAGSRAVAQVDRGPMIKELTNTVVTLQKELTELQTQLDQDKNPLMGPDGKAVSLVVVPSNAQTPANVIAPTPLPARAEAPTVVQPVVQARVISSQLDSVVLPRAPEIVAAPSTPRDAAESTEAAPALAPAAAAVSPARVISSQLDTGTTRGPPAYMGTTASTVVPAMAQARVISTQRITQEPAGPVLTERALPVTEPKPLDALLTQDMEEAMSVTAGTEELVMEGQPLVMEEPYLVMPAPTMIMPVTGGMEPPTHPDFAGTWLLTDVTGDMDSILEALGVGEAVRATIAARQYGKGEEKKVIGYDNGHMVSYLEPENPEGQTDVFSLGDGYDKSEPPKKRTVSWESNDGEQTLKIRLQDFLGDSPPEEWTWQLKDETTHEVVWSCGGFTATMTYTAISG